jgi:hypothetical protein
MATDFSLTNVLFDPAEALGINPHQWIPGLPGPGEVLGMPGLSGGVEPEDPKPINGRADVRGAILRGQEAGGRTSGGEAGAFAGGNPQQSQMLASMDSQRRNEALQSPYLADALRSDHSWMAG